MFLTYLMLVVALSLSAIAAFYSIIGLTAIFAAAVIPVAVMGTILEIAKLTVTVWLHEYWQQCKRSMKAYLVPAVGILMLITSMGIFGFLSKAHLDQAVPAGDISAQVSIFDEKIKTQRDNIEAARAALRQLDAAVDQTMSRSADEKGAERAVQIRRNQAAERTRLQNDIGRAQTEIARLQEQRAPIAAQARKVEAEVGPIKYIAALIYGDNPDQNLLEKAVRWVIIILVTVFDPLAIFMLLAATESYKWEKKRRRGETVQDPVSEPTPAMASAMKSWQERMSKWRKRDANDNNDAGAAQDLVDKPAGSSVVNKSVVAMVEPIASEQTVTKPTETPKIEYRVLDDADDEDALEHVPPVIHLPDQSHDDDDDDEDDVDDNEQIKEAKRRWKTDNPNDTLKRHRRLLRSGQIEHEPWEDYLDQIKHEMGFGRDLPRRGAKGDQFVVTGYQPTRLYKHNGEKWIEVDKNTTDQYAYNDLYIDYLIGLIGKNEYDPELLTTVERDQIEQRLRKNFE